MRLPQRKPGMPTLLPKEVTRMFSSLFDYFGAVLALLGNGLITW